ncbi:hypothetical protein HYC85_011584 [Camellia sinensis]|uniref:USP domain-containing protein n=1 Tax=Camellia sinensis TaxID=4442 RepID=A0A7J7HBE0_CAMSI|nr:hypothetical protein HYC85_011584 [Camellia sinensis]
MKPSTSISLSLRFGTSLMRKVKRCFTCYKPTESASGSKERYKGKMSCNLSETTSCGDGGYSEMIQNAISYCKDSLIKVANFEYIDEVEAAAAEEEARKASTENKTTTNNPDRASYWEESLKDRYEEQKVEEFNTMSKGNRSRKQMVSVEDKNLAGLEDVSSEREDNNYEAELTDEETTASGILTGRICNEYVMAWKRLTVRRPPNILTIALKRFQSERFRKLNKRVTFPETLDLSPYMSEVGDGNDVYKLYAVVVHVDMLNASFFGHYICYTRDFCGKWYRIDDCKRLIRKVSNCEKERTNSEAMREDIEMVDSESSSSVPQDIEVHGNGYSHAIEETASPVLYANRLVSAVGSSLSEMVKPEAYSQNSESDFPHSAVDENTAERSSTESSGELLDEISPVDCNGEQAKMETGKGLPSSSSTKDATGKLARRNSSEGKLKPLFPPGFLRKHSGNNSPKRGGKAKAPSELAECASYNPNKVISGFAKPGFLNQNGARTKDVGKSHSKCSSSSSPTFEERVGNHLGKDVMVLSGSSDFNHCNGDSGAFVISDEGVSYISGDDQQSAGKTSSYKEELHESETTPEKIRTDSKKPRATRRSSMRVLMSCGFCSASSSLSMILGLMGCGFCSSSGSMILRFVMECVFILLELPKTELEGVVWMILGFMGWGCGGGGSCFW